MRKQTILILAAMLISAGTQAQSARWKKKTGEIAAKNSDGYVTRTGVYLLPKKIRACPSRTYHWFLAQEIKSTRGAYSGKLLTGESISYYTDRTIREQGRFRKGMQTGTWRQWHTNGQPAGTEKWKRGRKTGRFEVYDENGNLALKGRYRDGRYHGKVTEYRADTVVVEVYRNGVGKVGRRQPAFRRGKEAGLPAVASAKAGGSGHRAKDKHLSDKETLEQRIDSVSVEKESAKESEEKVSLWKRLFAKKKAEQDGQPEKILKDEPERKDSFFRRWLERMKGKRAAVTGSSPHVGEAGGSNALTPGPSPTGEGRP